MRIAGINLAEKIKGLFGGAAAPPEGESPLPEGSVAETPVRSPRGRALLYVLSVFVGAVMSARAIGASWEQAGWSGLMAVIGLYAPSPKRAATGNKAAREEPGDGAGS